MQIKPFVFRTLSLLVFLFSSSVSFAQDQTFEDWLMELRADARSQGISDETLDAAFATVEAPIPRVLELDRSQPEFEQTFTGYMRNRMSQARIERGQALLEEHRELFQRIQNEYGVQPHYLVSFWALESNFGDFTGGFSVINALATLAYDPRRNDMFRSELITALRIIEEGHISAEQMSGSWAGAMGQCQFMPTTFYRYAKDGDGDGRIDIWNSVPDVFASAANFLSQSGWRGDERWGREVILPEGFDFTLTGTGVRKTVTEWNSLGITRVNKSPLGNADLEGSIVLPAGSNGPAFLAYNNFRTTMVWNRSTYYAISVGHLADRFVGGGPIMYMPENEERPMSRELVTELQTLLNAQGVDAGEPDGILGSRTRAAVRAYQEQANLPTDGYPSFELLEQLREL
ncbi:MAG: lytic murein transglycosylase [Gammaproteobacteria bacterium]|nr:lytic murein transglycosylase [Gammaproteobacteria bacterium]